jgi:SAM-dependent methyltransferase
MKIHHDDLLDVTRYIEHHRHITLESHNAEFESIMWRIKRFVKVDGSTRILEVGTGTGWFPIMCKLKGVSCRGLEISPQLVEYGLQFGREHGVEADIELGNIEDADMGTAQYDVVIAWSVLEHVEHWESALGKIADALRPGGVLYVLSTNKFALKSHEYNMPLYGWLPDRWRYRLRRMRQGDDIMKLGIDFNQFTHPRLRRCLKHVGFSRVMDVIELLDPENLRMPSRGKRIAIRTLRLVPPLKAAVLTFVPYTIFLCVK